MLNVESVVKKFRQGSNEVRALNGLSMQIEQGKFIAIMGPSGCGKSTLLHVMSGLTNVDAGKVEINGNDISRFSDRELTQFRRNHIGLVFQSFNLITSLTAYDNVRLPMKDTNDSKKKVERILARMGLQDRIHHRPAAMSGGEQQRVAIARALINDPAVVFADEPTGSLDSVTGQEVCRILHELCDEQGKSVVLVTHEPNVARWASKVFVMRDGNIVNTFDVEEGADANWLASRYQESLTCDASVV